jgi:hypothetical protein
MKFIFGSSTKADEINYLLSNVKKVVRQGFYEKELIGVERFCKQKKLFLVKSEFKVLLMEEGYTNKGMRVPIKDKRQGMYFVYISKDEKYALLAAYYELVSNNRELGEILGYPKCCIDYFLKNFNSKNTNPQVKSTNIFTNISKRNQDCVLISHFPCSSNCPGSILIGKKNLDVLRKVDPIRAREVRRKLEENQK